MRLAAAALAAVLAGSLPASAAPASETDYLKRAGNFLAHCDARKDAAGNRPEANYVCLAFMAGLIEGYNYAAVANGNTRPYCLPRPTTLVELSDMMTTVIERGAPPDLPTAAVFHFILQANFKCADEGAAAATPPANAPASGAPAAAPPAQGEAPAGAAPQKDSALTPGDAPILLAQAETILPVTPPAEVEASERKLPIVTPAEEASEDPLLPVIDPVETTDLPPRTGAPSPRSKPGAASAGPFTPGADAASPSPDLAAPEPAPAAAPAVGTEYLPGTSVGAPSAAGPDSAVGPGSAVGPSGAIGPGESGAIGPESAEGPIRVPRDGNVTSSGAVPIVVDPLAKPQGPATPVLPSTPAAPEPPASVQSGQPLVDN